MKKKLIDELLKLRAELEAAKKLGDHDLAADIELELEDCLSAHRREQKGEVK